MARAEADQGGDVGAQMRGTDRRDDGAQASIGGRRRRGEEAWSKRQQERMRGTHIDLFG